MAVTVQGGRVVGLNGDDGVETRFTTGRIDVLGAKLGLDQVAVLAHGVANGCLVKDGQERRDGQRWLRRSLRRAPGAKRAALLLLSSLGVGPFRPYQFGDQAVSQTSVPAAPRDGRRLRWPS